MSHISLKQITAIHQALSDPLRILIVHMLMQRELLVGELVMTLKEPQHKVSRHLAVLKNAGVVKDWKEGTRVHYSIAPSLGPEWRQVLEQLRLCWNRSPEVTATGRRLQQTVSRLPVTLAAKED